MYNLCRKQKSISLILWDMHICVYFFWKKKRPIPLPTLPFPFLPFTRVWIFIDHHNLAAFKEKIQTILLPERGIIFVQFHNSEWYLLCNSTIPNTLLQMSHPDTDKLVNENSLSLSVAPDQTSTKSSWYPHVIQPCVAEFIGIVLFVFIGVVAATVKGTLLIDVALAHGFTITLLVVALGHIRYVSAST